MLSALCCYYSHYLSVEMQNHQHNAEFEYNLDMDFDPVIGKLMHNYWFANIM
jgi:hypothetical protein